MSNRESDRIESGSTPDVVDGRIVRLRGHAWGVSLGLLLGIGLLLATLVLVLMGGEDVGPHLRLLGQYFPGYSVSALGSLIGLGYGFLVGYAAGRLICAVYNRAAGG